MPNFRIIPSEEFVLLLPELAYLKNAVRNENGRVVSSIGKADLSFGFDDTV